MASRADDLRIPRFMRVPEPTGGPVGRFIRRVLVVGLLSVGVVGGLMLPALNTTTEPTSPMELVFCRSTIDVRCQPANAPILIELGIIPSGGVTVSTGVTASANVVAGSAAAVGVASVILTDNCVEGGYCAPAGLRSKGWEGVGYKPEPTWTPPGHGSSSGLCTRVQLAQIRNITPSWGTRPAACNAHTSVQGGRLNVDIERVGSSLEVTSTVVAKASGNHFQSSWAYMFFTCIRPSANPVMYHNVAGSHRAIDLGASALQVGQVFNDVFPVMTCTQDAGAAYPLLVLSHSSSPTVGDTVSIVWTPQGAWDAPVEGTVTVQTRSQVDCRDKDGVDRRVSAAPIATTYNTAAIGRGVPFPDAVCLPTEIAVGGGLEVSHDGGTSWTKVGESAPVPEVVVGLPNQFPDCFATGAACQLVLWKKTPGGGLESCGRIGELCAGWAQTPRDLVELQYECRYGKYVVGIDLCSAYRDPLGGVQANTDPDGNPIPYDKPRPVAGVQPIVDPDTGEVIYVDPTTGEVVPDMPEAARCWPTGWGIFNPMSWVLMPLQCAFTPRHSVVAGIASTAGTIWAGTLPGQAAMLAGGITGLLPSGIGSSCQGPPVTFAGAEALGIGGTWYPLDACSQPMSVFRDVAYWGLPVLVAFAAVLASIRYLAAIVAFPGLAASPGLNSKKGDD